MQQSLNEERSLPEEFYKDDSIVKTTEVERSLPEEFYQSDEYLGYSPYEETTEEKEIAKNQDEFALQQQSRHHKNLNQDAVELLKTEPQTYDSIKNNTEIQEAAVRMAEE